MQDNLPRPDDTERQPVSPEQDAVLPSETTSRPDEKTTETGNADDEQKSSSTTGPVLEGESERPESISGSTEDLFPMASFPMGLDVSSYQNTITWSSVAADNRVFAYIKATEGVSFTDPNFATNWTKARQANMIRGAYHFYRPQGDALAQANHFINVVKSLGAGDLPPVVDVEVTDGITANVILNGIETWLNRVQQALGRIPIIYTGPSFWHDQLGNSSRFSQKHPLWIAHYTPANQPLLAGGWKTWTFWQYTSTGRVKGIAGDVDLDRFNGTLQQLRALARL